ESISSGAGVQPGPVISASARLKLTADLSFYCDDSGDFRWMYLFIEGQELRRDEEILIVRMIQEATQRGEVKSANLIGIIHWRNHPGARNTKILQRTPEFTCNPGRCGCLELYRKPGRTVFKN
ncbi:MAG: hypothetical protein KAU31_16745, partial [Spirochaetaceae bacterium]|nr:hypothetical protein [Spirochaetaceae bacterium]